MLLLNHRLGKLHSVNLRCPSRDLRGFVSVQLLVKGHLALQASCHSCPFGQIAREILPAHRYHEVAVLEGVGIIKVLKKLKSNNLFFSSWRTDRTDKVFKLFSYIVNCEEHLFQFLQCLYLNCQVVPFKHAACVLLSWCDTFEVIFSTLPSLPHSLVCHCQAASKEPRHNAHPEAKPGIYQKMFWPLKQKLCWLVNRVPSIYEGFSSTCMRFILGCNAKSSWIPLIVYHQDL